MPRTTVNVYPSGSKLGKRTTNQRRNDQNLEMATLGTLLPFPEDSALTKDKISVIRLTGAYLKFQKFLQDVSTVKVSQDSQQLKTVAGNKNTKLQSDNVKTQSDLFASLLSKALDGFIIIVDQAGTVLFVSSDAADYISLTPSEITGHTLYEVSHHDDDKIIKKNLMLNDGDVIEGNQIWRQFCVRVRSSMSGLRSQVTQFGGFNMIHVSGFLKLICKGDESGVNGATYSSITVSPSNIDNYRVIGLVAECHLIESPVIMELSIQHSTFAGEVSLDLKFASVDTRVMQVLGFEKDDLIGQKIFDFFHPKEYYRTEHFVCWKKLMCQGRSTSPVYRFLTKNGEWIWMQMSATLTYIPNTNIPYAANYIFKVINSENTDSGKKYKLVEHNEEYVMESNNCLTDAMKPHFPPPFKNIKNRPKENVNHVVNSLKNTPLSEVAREAFFHARNVGLDTFIAGIQPARLEDGTEPVKMVPDYTENATLDSVFVPPTMSCSGAIPYGPDLYMPSMCTQDFSTNSTSQSFPSSLTPSPASTETVVSGLSSGHQQQPSSSSNPSSSESHGTGANYSPPSGYVSSPGELSMLPNHPISSQQLENHNYLQHSNDLWPTAVKSREPIYKNGSVSFHNNLNSTVTSTTPISPHNDFNISLPDSDLSVFDSLAAFDPLESDTLIGLEETSQQLASQKQCNNGFSPLDSSIDELIDQLIGEITAAEGGDVNSYSDIPTSSFI